MAKLPEGFEVVESQAISMPEGFEVVQSAESTQAQDIGENKSFGSSVADAITGESRMTTEMENLGEIGNAPELNEMSWSAFKTSLGLLATGDEEKAKGVIKSNIPDAQFTQDSAGNTIVNLPSGQYALNKPGVSPQDIAKGVFDIAAFTPAGRAGTVGRAALGAGATEAALQGVTQELGGGQVSGKDVMAATLLGGAGKAAEDVIGGGYRMLKGAPETEAQKVAKFAQEQDLPLMTTDVVEPGTFVGKSAQSAAEKIPLTGTGGMRETQQAAREKLVSDFAQKFGEYNPEEVVSSLQRQTSKVKQAAGSSRQGVVNAMSDTQIPMDNVIKSIDDEIYRLSRTPSGELRETADMATVQKLNSYKNDLQADPSFANLEQLRTQFRTDVKGERMVMPGRSEAAVNRIYSSMGKDMDDGIKNTLGDQASSKWKKSNAIYANEANKVKNTRLKSVLQKGDLTPEVVNNLIYSNKPSEFKNLYRSLDTKGKASARSALIGKAFEKSGGSPDRFFNDLNKISSQLGVTFKGQDKKFLDGLMKYIDTTRQASKAELVTPTGQQLFQIAAPVGIVGDISSTGGLGTAAGFGYGALARVYESKPVRNALMKLNALPKGSSEFERQLASVSAMLSSSAQAARRE